MSNENDIYIMDILSDYLAIVEALILMLVASYLVYKDQLRIMQILSISDQYEEITFLYFLDLWIRIIQEIFVIIRFYNQSEFITQTTSITAQLESACRYGLYLVFYLSISKQLKKQYKVPNINGEKKGIYLRVFNIVNIGLYYLILSLGFKSFIDEQSPGGTQKSLLSLVKLSIGVSWSLGNMIYFFLHQPEEINENMFPDILCFFMSDLSNYQELVFQGLVVKNQLLESRVNMWVSKYFICYTFFILSVVCPLYSYYYYFLLYEIILQEKQCKKLILCIQQFYQLYSCILLQNYNDRQEKKRRRNNVVQILQFLRDYIELSCCFCIIVIIWIRAYKVVQQNRVGAIILLSILSLIFRFLFELFIIICYYQTNQTFIDRLEFFQGIFQAIQSICRITLFYVFFNIISKFKMIQKQKKLSRYLYIFNQIIYMSINTLSLYLFKQSQDPEQIFFGIKFYYKLPDYWNIIRYGTFIVWVLLNWAFIYFMKKDQFSKIDTQVINWILFQITASGFIFLIYALRIKIFNDQLHILDCQQTQLICSRPWLGFATYTLFIIQIKLYIPILTILWYIVDNSEKFLENISIK